MEQGVALSFPASGSAVKENALGVNNISTRITMKGMHLFIILMRASTVFSII